MRTYARMHASTNVAFITINIIIAAAAAAAGVYFYCYSACSMFTCIHVLIDIHWSVLFHSSGKLNNNNEEYVSQFL